MNFIFEPWHLALVILAGWANRQQQEVIEYLRTENQVLKEKLGKKRILLSDDQRSRLAVKGKVLGHDLAVASDAGGGEVGLQQTSQICGSATCRARDRRSCSAVRR